MGIREYIGKQLRSFLFNGEDVSGIFGVGYGNAGQPVTDMNIFQQAAFISGVRLITENFASLPVEVIYEDDEGNRSVAKNHPIFKLLYCAPNYEMTAAVFNQTALTHNILYGDTFIRIISGRSGNITGFELLFPPATVEYNDHYETWIRTEPMSAGELVKLTKDEVIKIPFMYVGNDFFRGKGLIRLSANPISLALALDTFSGSYFKNGATYGGYFSSDKSMPAEVKDRLARYFGNENVGSGNAFKTVVLPDGIKYNKITNTPQESQSIEQRNFQVEEIARILRIPAALIGANVKQSKQNLEQQNLEFLQYTILPIVRKFEQAYTQKCFLGSEADNYSVRFNFQELLRTDMLTQAQSYAIMRQNGVICGNEWRRALNMNTVDDPTCTAFLVLSNMGGVGYQNTADNIQKQIQAVNTADNPEDELPGTDATRSLVPPQIIFESIISDTANRLLRKQLNIVKNLEKTNEVRSGTQAITGEKVMESLGFDEIITPLFRSFAAATNSLSSVDARITRARAQYLKQFSTESNVGTIRELLVAECH
jgi:HK97 family phage portal protein